MGNSGSELDAVVDALSALMKDDADTHFALVVIRPGETTARKIEIVANMPPAELVYAVNDWGAGRSDRSPR